MTVNYYFDQTGPLKPYTHSLAANPGSLPPENAARLEPVFAPGLWPCWDGEAWALIEDYRGQKGYDKTTGAESEIKNLGPWPEDLAVSPPPPAPPTPEEIQARMMAAIQARLDAFARTRGYDNIFTATTYAASNNETYRVEGQYAVQARDDTWNAAYAILGAVLTGQRPMPTEEEVMAELPELKWPNDDPLRDVAVSA